MNIRAAVAAALAASLCCAASARADDIFTTGLYTDLGYTGADPDFKKIANVYTPSFMDGVEADMGWRFNRFYSVEASYSYYTGAKNFVGTSFHNTLQTASIDGLGYLPLGYESQWALFGDAGGTAYFESYGTVAGTAHQTRFGARAGGGVQYQFTVDLGVRVEGRYDWADLSNMRSAKVFTIGLVWQQ